ncbi:hypothetical protein LguiB_033525 [Lonicera macranthoides]
MELNHFSHDHPLMLVNQVQKEECEKDIVCYGCQKPISSATSETTSEDEIGPSVMKFPIVDKSVNLLDELLKGANLGDAYRAKTLTHFSHDHLLILFDNEDEMKNDEIIICKVTIQMNSIVSFAMKRYTQSSGFITVANVINHFILNVFLQIFSTVHMASMLGTPLKLAFTCISSHLFFVRLVSCAIDAIV